MNMIKRYKWIMIPWLAMVLAILASTFMIDAKRYEAAVFKQENASGTGTSGNWNSQFTLFTASSTYYLTKIGLWVQRYSTTTGEVTFHLDSVASSKPDKSPFLASTGAYTFDGWSNSAYVYREFVFTTPYEVQSGTSYAIVYEYSGQSPAQSYFTYSKGNGTNGGYGDYPDVASSTYSTSTTTFKMLIYGYDSTDLPTAPSGLSVAWDYGLHGSYIDNWCPELTWTDNSSNETLWTIMFATDSGFTENVVQWDIDASWGSPYIDNYTGWASYTGEDTLYYKVAAKNGDGTSAFSAAASISTLDVLTDGMQAPYNFTATFTDVTVDTGTLYYIALDWDYEDVDEADEFEIQRASDAGFTTDLVRFNQTLYPSLSPALSVGVEAFIDIYGIQDLEEGTYYYRIKATKASPLDESTWSATATVALSSGDITDISGGTVNPPLPPTVTPVVNDGFLGGIDLSDPDSWSTGMRWIIMICLMLVAYILLYQYSQTLALGASAAVFLGFLATGLIDLWLILLAGAIAVLIYYKKATA